MVAEGVYNSTVEAEDVGGIAEESKRSRGDWYKNLRSALQGKMNRRCFELGQLCFHSFCLQVFSCSFCLYFFRHDCLREGRRDLP